MSRLAGRVAVVTGGARGIGLAVAERFVASGADVVISARSPSALAEAQGRLQALCDGDPRRSSVRRTRLPVR